MRLLRLFLAVLASLGLVATEISTAQGISEDLHATIDVGGNPIESYVVHGAGTVFVADASGTITLYEGFDRVVKRTTGLGEIRDMTDYFEGDTVVLLVLSANPPRLTAFDLDSGDKVWTKALPGADPTSVLNDWRGSRWLVTDRATGDVITPTGRIAVSGQPIALAGPTSDGEIIVLSPQSLSVISGTPSEASTPIALPGTATDVELGGGQAFVSTAEGALVKVDLDTRSVVDSYAIGGRFTGLRLLYWSRIAYIQDFDGSRLVLVDTLNGDVLGSVGFPTPPSGLELIWDEYRMYVTSEAGGRIYDIDIKLTKRPGKPRGARATCSTAAESTVARVMWSEPALVPEGPLRGYKVRIKLEGLKAKRWYQTTRTEMEFEWNVGFRRGAVITFEIAATSFAGPSRYARATCTLR